MPAKKAASGGPVQLRRITDEVIQVPIIGLTPMIPHQWSEKAIRMMRNKQQGLTTDKVRPAKNIEEEAEAAMYRLEDGRAGMPATAFKAAMVGACRFFSGVPMTEGRLLISVRGEGPQGLVPISGTERIREDMPRNATGVVDLRYRTELIAGVDGIEPWRADLIIAFPPTLISAESVIALADASGRVGVGDWRPGSPKSNSGIYGTYRIDDAQLTAG